MRTIWPGEPGVMAVPPKQKRLTRLSRRGKRGWTRDERDGEGERGRKALRKDLLLDALALGQVFIRLKTPPDAKSAPARTLLELPHNPKTSLGFTEWIGSPHDPVHPHPPIHPPQRDLRGRKEEETGGGDGGLEGRRKVS